MNINEPQTDVTDSVRDYLGRLRNVIKRADDMVEIMHEFENDPVAWSEPLQALNDALREIGLGTAKYDWAKEQLTADRQESVN